MKRELTSAEIAAALKISPGRVRQLGAAGVLPRTSSGRYSLTACRAAYQSYKKAVAAAGDESEYLVYLKLKNDLLEKQNKIRAGDLISVEDFLTAGLKIVGNARAKLLPIPSKAAPLLVGSDDKTARQLLSRFVDESIRELKIPDFRRIARDRQKLKYDRRKK